MRAKTDPRLGRLPTDILTEAAVAVPKQIERWSQAGPYYGIFRTDFAMQVVKALSAPGDYVLDPFSGRGTTPFAAAACGRNAVGMEINSVGWLYGKVKLSPAQEKDVVARIRQIWTERESLSASHFLASPFFKMAYGTETLKFLTAARNTLEWETDPVDRTAMFFILTHLHGDAGRELSNQMRRAKAMRPSYMVRWWRDNGYSTPPDHDCFAFLAPRIRRRYAKGHPQFDDSEIFFGDCTAIMPTLKPAKPFSLVLTSPPYHDVTDYHEDQWLRLWMLGGEDRPRRRRSDTGKGRFTNQEHYVSFLNDVFAKASEISASDAAVYVRTHAKEFTLEATKAALVAAWGKTHDMAVFKRPIRDTSRTVTAIFGDKGPKPGEADIMMVPK